MESADTDAPGVLLPQETYTALSVATNPHEVLIAFGKYKQAINGTNGAIQVTGVDWGRLISISPTTAHALIFHLEDALKNYETHFGKIPTDPAFEAAKAALISNADKPE